MDRRATIKSTLANKTPANTPTKHSPLPETEMDVEENVYEEGDDDLQGIPTLIDLNEERLVYNSEQQVVINMNTNTIFSDGSDNPIVINEDGLCVDTDLGLFVIEVNTLGPIGLNEKGECVVQNREAVYRYLLNKRDKLNNQIIQLEELMNEEEETQE